MKKILMGVCNLGQGHVNREKQLIELFLELDYQVCIVTSNISDFNYANVKKIYCSVPWIATDNNGINFNNCLNNYTNQNFFKEFLEMCIGIEEYFCGQPDIVISDYEPNVAQYAYARNLKLINLEQQSKYLYIDKDNINDISILEEKSRLQYFFPKSDLHIISSFFQLDNKEEDNVIVTSPIINKDVLISEKGDYVIVYFSPYGNQNYLDLYKKIMCMIYDIDNIKFKIYTSLDFDVIEKDNIDVIKFNDNFKNDLSKCKFVISTSGHQLISECLYLEKPLLLTSFSTFEQNYNKAMILENGLGNELVDFDKREVIQFDQNLEKYIQNIRKYNIESDFGDWKEILLSKIEELICDDKHKNR